MCVHLSLLVGLSGPDMRDLLLSTCLTPRKMISPQKSKVWGYVSSYGETAVFSLEFGNPKNWGCLDQRVFSDLTEAWAFAAGHRHRFAIWFSFLSSSRGLGFGILSTSLSSEPCLRSFAGRLALMGRLCSWCLQTMSKGHFTVISLRRTMPS